MGAHISHTYISHMKPSSRPSGFHVEHLDTALIEQIIATDIDTAIRALSREKGIHVDDAQRHAWLEVILETISGKLRSTADVHSLLPDQIDQVIAAEIKRLMQEFTPQTAVLDCGSMFLPKHGVFQLHRHAMVLCRKLFEKRLE